MKMERIANIRNVRDWTEPAHPSIVKLNDDLVSIYSHIREKYQEKVDNAFDRVSRQIGFVVATSVPMVLETGKKGAVKSFNIGAEHLKDTLFDRELSSVFKSMESQDPDGEPAIAGLSGNSTYNVQLLWFEALKLKLRTDWIEPAHFLRARLPERLRPETARRLADKELIAGCEWCEPAHWFDPGIAIRDEEIILIEAIDEVYPELQLGDRVASYREMVRRTVPGVTGAERYQVGPGVREPAHYHIVPELRDTAQYRGGMALREPAQYPETRMQYPEIPYVREPAHLPVGPGIMEPAHYHIYPGVREPAQYQVGPGVREPAHFRRFDRELLSELSTMLRKYGY